MTRADVATAAWGAARPGVASYWRRLAADTLLVSRAMVVCHLLGAVTSIALRMVLEPAAMGIWQGLKLAISYGNYSNLGISKAAIRDYTVALGREDHATPAITHGATSETRAAEQCLNVAFTVNTLASVVYATVMTMAAAAIVLTGSGVWSQTWACGLALVGLLAVVQRYVSFQITILRARQAFDQTSMVSIVEAVVTALAATALAWSFGVLGLCAATLLVSLASLVYLRRAGAWTALAWTWNTTDIRRLVRAGMPLLAAGVVFSLFRSVDRLAILACLDDREQTLGLYSIALMASTQLFGLANMLAIVVGPRLARQFGQTGQRGDVAALAARTIELIAAMLVLPAAVVLVMAPAVVGWLLPQYQAGLPALVWMVPGTVLLGMTLPAGQCLVAVYRERAQLALIGLATLVAVAGTLVALRGGWGLVGVSAAMTLANVVYFAAVVTLAIRGPLAGRAWRACLVRWAAVGLPTLATALLITQTMTPGLGAFDFGGTTLYAAAQTTWFVLVLRLLLIVSVWLATIAAAWRWGGWSQLLAHGDIATGGAP